MENDGFSLDDKRVPIDKNDIPDIIERFEKRKEEPNKDRRKKHFFVSAKEIKENDWDLSFSKYREIEYKEKRYEKPEMIKEKLVKIEKEIMKTLQEINTR